MTAAALLERLERVKETGRGQWAARCPAHEDRSPSLSIREHDDGRVLLHDHGGCRVEDVLSAVGLKFSDLFPAKPVGDVRRERVPFDPLQVLRAVADEMWVVAVIISGIARGEPLTSERETRLLLAGRRLIDAADAAVPAKPKRLAMEVADA